MVRFPLIKCVRFLRLFISLKAFEFLSFSQLEFWIFFSFTIGVLILIFLYSVEQIYFTTYLLRQILLYKAYYLAQKLDSNLSIFCYPCICILGEITKDKYSFFLKLSLVVSNGRFQSSLKMNLQRIPYKNLCN